MPWNIQLEIYTPSELYLEDIQQILEGKDHKVKKNC